MAALGLTVANDIATAALIYYIRGDALSQTTQDKPLLKWFREHKKTFPSGNLQVDGKVQGTYMSDTPGFVQGFSEDDSINFAQASNLLDVVYNWKETITSLIITWTELLKDGITVTDDMGGGAGGKTKDHAGVDATRITSLMKNRLEDWGESDSRGYNTMYWQDGTQDPKQPAGVFSILTDNASVGTTGGLNRATYWWWRHRVNLGLQASAQNSTLIQFFNSELVQLKRCGGKPDKALCGSGFLDGLRMELFAKGYFTMGGFKGSQATELGMGSVHISGMGTFEYDPTLDSMNMSKRCVVLDSSHLKLRPMEDEEDHMLLPARPYQYLVLLKSVKRTGCIYCDQLSGMGVYQIQ